MDGDSRCSYRAPSVVISIDFEMRWGMHDIYGLNFDGYRENLENCRPAVAATLKLLAERGLRATWASVGALGAKDWGEYFELAPPPPAYANPKLKVLRQYADMDPDGTLHFAPDLIRAILDTKGQDLGSHSFSHLYFREPGVTVRDFLADMAAVERLWRTRFGVIPVSLVYPRNQCAFEHLLDNTSIRIWRGPEPAWFYDHSTQRTNTLLPRALRLMDSISPWTSRASRMEDRMVRASVFVRFGLSEALWRLQVARIRNEIARILPGTIFHLWWHPHNLGSEVKVRFARLAQVLDLVAEACATDKIISKSMKDCVTRYP